MASPDQRPYPRPFGPYVLLDELGRGGMGTVSLACREAMAGILRQCVVKTLRADHVADGEYVRRFLDEARVVVRLQHSHICPVFDVGVIDGEHYLAMEYVAGRDLRLVLAALQKSGLALEPGLALYVVNAVLEALDYAHRLVDPGTGRPLQLIHRDVSPHNVMLGFEGDVRLIDFGLAQSTLKVEKTAPQIVLGKLAYMAPEQVYGLPLDPRADQFAAAVMAYELVSGERFYGGRALSELQALAAQGNFRPAGFRALPTDLQMILDRALQPRRDDRWPTCGALREALEVWRFKAGWRGDAAMLRALLQRVCADEIALEAQRQRRYASQLQAAADAGLTQSHAVPAQPLPTFLASSSAAPDGPPATQPFPVAEQRTPTFAATASFLGSTPPAPPVSSTPPGIVGQTISFLGASHLAPAAPPAPPPSAGVRRTMPTMPISASTPATADAGAPQHTQAIHASAPPEWAQQGLRTTMPTMPISTPKEASGRTMMTMPMAALSQPPANAQAAATTAPSPPAPPVPPAPAGSNQTSIETERVARSSPPAPAGMNKLVYVVGGAVGSAALLVAGMWLGQQKNDPLRFDAPQATTPVAATAAPTTAAGAGPAATTAPVTTGAPTATASPATPSAPTAPASVPLARPATTKPPSSDPRIIAARERLNSLKSQCPDSGCIPHYEWLLSQPAPSSQELSAAPRALDLCLAQCTANNGG